MTQSACLEADELLPRASYVRDLRHELPAEVFARATSRLAFLPVHVAVIVMAAIAIAASWTPWFVVPALSLVIGASFAGLTFIAHETLHGAIVRGRRAQYAVGFLGFLPFLVSPQLWIAWHNTEHHARANLHDDPDAYPTIERYQAEAGARFAVDAFSLGGGRWRGGLSLILGFTVQSAAQLIGAQRYKILTPVQHKRAWFGYHVEHHLFPAMSARHGETVRTLLQRHWPERYHSMSLGGALLRLHRSGRVYKSAITLYDPRSGSEHATL